MSARSHRRSGLLIMPLACAVLSACTSTSHVSAYQERRIAAAPRSLALALDPGESLPFGIAPAVVARAAADAGFVLGSNTPRYRLALSAASGASDAGSYLPADRAVHNWVARPDRNWRARFADGRVLRITAVLIDGEDNREVWRGTGTLRTRDPAAAAPQLAREVLAKLPHG